MDSRGPTLYATGRESGALYAFNVRGELLSRYQIVNSAKDGGNSFLSGCIQTRYQLIIIDSYNPNMYFLKLADTGPNRGKPPPQSPTHRLQGYEIPLEGFWNQTASRFNAFGVEWTSKFNETGFVMNSATGELFTMDLNRTQIFGYMRKVNIFGAVSKFPGALQILFDSKNENIMYITMLHLNAIAVLEFSRLNPRYAKFIRWITSPLLDSPVAVSEFGEWIFPINARFSKSSGGATYSFIKLPRHKQELNDSDPEQEFTTTFDRPPQTPPPEAKDLNDVKLELQRPPKMVGTSAPKPIQTNSPSPQNPNPSTPPGGPTTAPPTTTSGSGPASGTNSPSSIFQVDDEDEDDQSGSCFPAAATVRTQDRGVVRMDRLAIGDRVVAGRDANGNELYSGVFLFSHQDSDTVSDFVRIFSSNDRLLELSAGHYLYVNRKLVTASSVREGDSLVDEDGSSIRVSRVGKVRRRGLYNPQTMNGNIVVDGVLVSTYTTAIQPAVASALLTPVRAAYQCGTAFSRRIAEMLSRGGRGLERYFPHGQASYL